jgi:arabinan endo-1,5-alpha-L-arabinosidase
MRLPQVVLGRGLVVAAAAVLTMGLGASAGAAPSGQHPVSHDGPVINSNFPDPDILQVGNVYHAYATNSGGDNIQHQTSTDLVHWTKQPDALPTLGAWVDPACTFSPGGSTDRCVWAPDVTAVGNGYVLYYAARDLASQRQCIGVATSSSPNGPFVPVGTTPLVCPVAQGGAIDPATYRENGQLYLLWKADGNCCNLPAIIYLQPLSADGLTLTGPPTQLITNDQPFEGAVVEAPTLVKHNGTYVLFYSANNFAGGYYATGYATSSSITGPYTKSKTPLMSTDLFRNTVIGPGGQDVVVMPDGSTKIVFHGWDATYSYRAMYVRDLNWSGNVPSVEGASTRYEAENGTVVDARVLADDSASGGAKVGGLDHLDSSVTVTVTAAHAGPAMLGIRFANGSLDPGGYPVSSSDTLLVNGKVVTTVVFPHTTWGNWTMAHVEVFLHKGANTVTLRKATFYAEIDAIDVS